MDYIRHYNELCRSRQVSNILYTGTYYEKHHITPRCMGGTDDCDNIVLLTPREHYIAHLLLFKHHKKIESEYVRQLAFALVSMSGNNVNRNLKRFMTSSRYGVIREAAIVSRIGYTVSDTSSYRKPKSIEHRESIRRARVGSKWSDSVKMKMSDSHKGLPVLHNSFIIECSVCKKNGQMVAMKRWHFDNCKNGGINA